MCNPVAGAVLVMGAASLYQGMQNAQRNYDLQRQQLAEQRWYNRQTIGLQRAGLELEAEQLGISQGQLELQGEQLGISRGQLALQGEQLDISRGQLGIQYGQLGLRAEELQLQREQIYEENLALEKENLLSKREAYYAADVDDYNAALIQDEAAQTFVQEARDISEIKTSGRQFVGAQRAAVAGSGTVVDSGTSAGIIDESRANVQYDINTLRGNYARRRSALLAESRMLREEGTFKRSQGDILSGYNTVEEIQSGVKKPKQMTFALVNPERFGSWLSA